MNLSVGLPPANNQSLLAMGLIRINKSGFMGWQPLGQSTKGLFSLEQTGLHPLASADIGAAWKKTEIPDYKRDGALLGIAEAGVKGVTAKAGGQCGELRIAACDTWSGWTMMM